MYDETRCNNYQPFTLSLTSWFIVLVYIRQISRNWGPPDTVILLSLRTKILRIWVFQIYHFDAHGIKTYCIYFILYYLVISKNTPVNVVENVTNVKSKSLPFKFDIMRNII